MRDLFVVVFLVVGTHASAQEAKPPFREVEYAYGSINKFTSKAEEGKSKIRITLSLVGPTQKEIAASAEGTVDSRGMDKLHLEAYVILASKCGVSEESVVKSMDGFSWISFEAYVLGCFGKNGWDLASRDVDNKEIGKHYIEGTTFILKRSRP